MKKTLVILSLVMLLCVFAFTACKNTEQDETPDGQETIEYSTYENGNLFVTNVDGEEIPVTTDKDGYVELYKDLVTKSAQQVSKEQTETQTQAQTSSAPETTEKQQTSEKTQISVGTADMNDEEHDAVIDWR